MPIPFLKSFKTSYGLYSKRVKFTLKVKVHDLTSVHFSHFNSFHCLTCFLSWGHSEHFMSCFAPAVHPTWDALSSCQTSTHPFNNQLRKLVSLWSCPFSIFHSSYHMSWSRQNWNTSSSGTLGGSYCHWAMVSLICTPNEKKLNGFISWLVLCAFAFKGKPCLVTMTLDLMKQEMKQALGTEKGDSRVWLRIKIFQDLPP